MRKYLVWACLNGALVGFSALSFAAEFRVDREFDFASYSDNDADFSYISEEMYQATAPSHHYSEETIPRYVPATGSFLDNTLVFAGADTYKSIGERITNINGGTGALTSNFGGVMGFNTGFGIGANALRGQVGASYGIYDLRGRIRLVPQATNVEEQGFVTVGLSKRGDMLNDCDPLSYGVVLDAFRSNNWGVNANDVDLGQLRFTVGYALNKNVEIGGFGTAGLWDDEAAVTIAGAPAVVREIRAANQLNGYIRLNAAFGGSLTAYAGGFDGAAIQSWQFGAMGEAPISSWFSLYGNVNYAVPGATAGPTGSGEEQFNMQFGLTYYFGRKSVSGAVTGARGLPLLDVANNSSFLITD